MNMLNKDSDYNVETLGQVFTPLDIVSKMISLSTNLYNIKNNELEQEISILEPSCGDGRFLYKIQEMLDLCKNSKVNFVGIEIDANICPKGAKNIDFFDLSLDNKFDSIIGNPPYVKFKLINNDTKRKLNNYVNSLKEGSVNERINLYIYFIEKCIRHLKPGGELIFIVPRDFIKASSSALINQFLYREGTITDFIDFGDEKIFKGFTPNCVVFRFEKGNYSRITKIDNSNYLFSVQNGQIFFTKETYPLPLAKLFLVKVGGASGADNIFNHHKGNVEFVYSKTRKTGETKRMFYNLETDILLPYKNALLNRKIKNFNEKNWYKWGRNYFKTDLPRIYVNIRTRQKNPFYIHECKAFDGNILALFPKIENFKEFNLEILHELCQELNQVNWKELGFVCENRFIFSQSSLENTYLPEKFKKYCK